MAESDPIGDFSVSDHFDQPEGHVVEEILPNRDNYLHLPSNLLQAYAMKTNQHTGMYMVQLSIEAQRACNEAIVFVYGLSGHGKSQSLNHLFGFDVIPVANLSKASDTKSVTEYVVKLVSDSWEVKNLEIGFIDPPGWGDTEGEHQDAKNMAAIQQFIEHHPHLGSRIHKCYPNIILIAVNALEERLDGPEAGLCKMLNALKQLNIVDRKRPNILFMLTHAMGVPPGNFNEEVGHKTGIIKRNCKFYLGVEPIVVCLENKPDTYGLVMDGDWTILEWNGERQPLNLFRAMVKLMTANGDEVGVEALRIYFPNRGENQPVERSTISSDQIKIESVQKWRRIITQKSKPIINDECTKLIKKYEQENKKIPKDTFKPLMYEFNKAGINNKQQIHHKDIVEVQEIFFPFILGELEIDLIISQFGVRPVHYPEILQEFGTGLFLNDNSRLPESPIFQYAPSVTRKGVMLPECVHIRYCEDTQVVCNCITGDNQEEHNSQTTAGFVRFGPTNTEQLLISQNPRIQNPVMELQNHKFVFAIIHNIFRVDLQMNQAMLQHVSDGFKQAIQDLPDPQNREQDHEYLQFINKYGSCFRSTLEGGGIVTGEIELHIPKGYIPPTELLIKNHIQIYLTTMKRDQAQEAQLIEDRNSKQILNELYKCPLNWIGGTKPELYENNLNELNHDDFNQWKRSLHKNPITVDKMYSRIETNHIYEVVGQFNRVKASKIKQCLVHHVGESITNKYFEVSMIFHERSQRQETHVPPREEPVAPEIPENREDAVKVSTQITGFPTTAIVTRKKDRNHDAEVVRIEEVKEGDWVLCVDEHFRLIYDQVERADKINGDFYYLKFGYGNVKNFIAANNCHILSTNMKIKRADKTLIRDKIYSVITGDETKLKEYEVGSVKICKEPGNVRLQLHNREDLFLIVDGIVFGEPSCFPGNASVTLRGGERVRMDELKIGDYVLSIHSTTGKPVYSKVYLWAHRDPHTTATFLHITHPYGHLHISANHLILSGDKRRPVPADQLRVGDSVHFLSPCLSQQQQQQMDGKEEEEEGGDSHILISVPVLHIQTCTQVGYYAPFTNNGLIVVDDIAASVYSHISTHSESDSSSSSSSSSSWLWSGVWHSVTSGLVQQFGMHRVGQCVLTPVRVGCKLGVGSVLSHQMDTNTHMHKYCQWFLSKYMNK